MFIPEIVEFICGLKCNMTEIDPVLQDLMDTETTLSMKIARFFNENSIDLLLDVKEIEEGILYANELCDEYQSIHLKLKRGLDEPTYAGMQGDLDEAVDKFMAWIREAKTEVRRMKLVAKDKADKEEKEREEQRAIRGKAKVMTIREEELCRQKILNEIVTEYLRPEKDIS